MTHKKVVDRKGLRDYIVHCLRKDIKRVEVNVDWLETVCNELRDYDALKAVVAEHNAKVTEQAARAALDDFWNDFEKLFDRAFNRRTRDRSRFN